MNLAGMALFVSLVVALLLAYSLHLRGQVALLEAQRNHAVAINQRINADLAAATHNADALTDRLDQIVEAQRNHVAAVTQLRRQYAQILDLIRAQPDDGCLDRPLPDGLRGLTPGRRSAAGSHLRAVRDAAHALPETAAGS